MKKIGIFGGAFDPPHIGHLIAAQYAAEQLSLDKVIFVPSGNHPFKEGALVASAEQRFAMTKLAIAGNPLFDVSDVEIRKEGKSYTFETLEYFCSLYPNGTLSFLIGTDNIKDFSSWKHPEKIVEFATVVVLNREVVRIPKQENEFMARFLYLDTPTIEISSTEVRNRLAEHKAVRYMIRNGVELFLDMTGLYR
ncbi:MAG TPA: nicotinate-nucleotide adenylyltransferase [Candidatus Kapabacteria bacterium]